VAFTQNSSGADSRIQVADLSGTRKDIAAPGGLVLFPVFAPDGRRLAFQQDKDATRQIWSVSLEDGQLTELSVGNTRELSHPQWSARHPDRVLIVVDHRNLATLAIATGAVTPLTRFDESTRYVDYPSWSPDGTKVYFSMTRMVGDLFLLENLGGP
jgi:Tol biopolymer transport system component